MFKQAKPLFLIVETPLHAGSGNDLGIVDLATEEGLQLVLAATEADHLEVDEAALVEAE